MKKYIKAILVTCTLAIVFFACEKDEIDTFNGENLIYFQWAKDGINNYSGAKIDSTSFSFAYELPSVIDSVYKIPVKTQGFISENDRSFLVKVSTNSEVTQGTHFDLPATFTIPANEVIGYIPLTLFRAADLKTNILTLKLELTANENFSTNLIGNEKSSNANKLLNYNKFELTISDILTKPTLWDSFVVYYLGTFSVKKLYLYAEVNNIPVPNWNKNQPEISSFFTRKDVLKAYLQGQRAAGTPVLEDDGTEMVLGRYAKSNKIIKN